MSELTFRCRLPESALLVKDDLFVLRLDQVINDVRRRSVAPGVAEPFAAVKTLGASSANIIASNALLTLTTHCGL
jgi:hypothetical protein